MSYIDACIERSEDAGMIAGRVSRKRETAGSISAFEAHFKVWIKTIDDLTEREKLAVKTGFMAATNFAAQNGWVERN